MKSRLLSFWALASLPFTSAADFTLASEAAARYSLPSSTAPPFPESTLATQEAQQFIIDNWSLNRAHIQNSPDDISFISNPYPDSTPPSGPDGVSSSSPVLQVKYPQLSFSHETGGTQFYALFNGTEPYQSMVLSYEVAFSEGFEWVKGGKLPGIRGGPNSSGCSGGTQPTGNNCFSIRLMWRPVGTGEVYAYIPTPNGLCRDRSIICNPDFGTSIQRGSFGFQPGVWSRVTMIVQLNSPADVANGRIEMLFNDVPALSRSDLQIRANESINAGGLYFSTFFGGDDSSWASPKEQYTYYRNIRLWAGPNPSNATGEKVVSGALRQRRLLRQDLLAVAVASIYFARTLF